MAFLRYTVLLFASSMVVKIPLMALFHFGHLFLTGKGKFETLADAIANLRYTEIVLFIPLYFIYLPLFIYNVKTLRVQMRYLRTDMAMIGCICALLALVIGYLNTGLWMGIVLSVFCFVYFMLTAEVHARLTLPHIWGQENGPPPKDMDTTLPEYKEWQERWEARLRTEQEARIALAAEKKEKKDKEKKEESTANKITRIFFLTGLFATLLSAAVTVPIFLFLTALHSCLEDHRFECHYAEVFNILSFIDQPIYLLFIIIVPILVYIGLVFPIYGTLAKILWHRNMRSYAHFGLAANVIIFLYGLSHTIFPDNRDGYDIWLYFYIIGYTALLSSAIHLPLLKRYDKAFGIPDAPPRKRRWYESFFGIKIAET